MTREEQLNQIINRYETNAIEDDDIAWLIGNLKVATLMIYKANELITDLRTEVFSKDIEISELQHSTT